MAKCIAGFCGIESKMDSYSLLQIAPFLYQGHLCALGRERRAFDTLLAAKKKAMFARLRGGGRKLRKQGTRALTSNPVPVYDLRIRKMLGRRAKQDQGHSLLAHLGAHKTLGMLRDHVSWKTMVRDVHMSDV